MKNSFRENHIIKIFEEFEKSFCPLDLFLSNYFRKKKSIGSKDRKEIAERIYFITRWKGLIDYLAPKPVTNKSRIEISNIVDINKKFEDGSIPLHIRASFPKKYFDKIAKDYGEEEALNICYTSNFPAPTTIRVNSLKTTRDDLFENFNKKYDIKKTSHSPYGITFNKKINFFATEEFKKGLFEIQDEGSQLLADLINAKPKDHVLDFCAGAGGKTLAFAHKMKEKGQIYLYDIREKALLEAKKRLKRASVQNSQILLPEKSAKFFKNKKNYMDWILLDVPCSGSGTLRRNPDLKWRFDFDTYDKLLETQKNIFNKAFPLLKTGGNIVYATCSIFKDENEKQIKYFLDHNNLKLIKQVSWLPKQDSKDGFFAAVLQKK